MTFSFISHILWCNDNGKDRIIMDMATFAMGCMGYENQRNQGNLPQHDQEFQAETGIGPVYNWVDHKQDKNREKPLKKTAE